MERTMPEIATEAIIARFHASSRHREQKEMVDLRRGLSPTCRVASAR